MTEPVKVLIVDDHAMFRRGVRAENADDPVAIDVPPHRVAVRRAHPLLDPLDRGRHAPAKLCYRILIIVH